MGERRRPVRGRARCGPREPAPRRPRGRRADRVDRRERRTARPAGGDVPSCPRHRPDRAGRGRRGAAVDARPPRVRGRRRVAGDRADPSRPRRHARDRPRRGGRARRPRPRAVDDAAAALGHGAPHGRAAVPSGARGRARRRGVLRGVHLEPRTLRSRSRRPEASRPDERRARRAPDDPPPWPRRGRAGERRRRQRGRAPLRDSPGSTCRRASRCPTSGGASAGSRRAGSVSHAVPSRRFTRRSTSRSRHAARRLRTSTRARGPRPTPGGSASSIPRSSRAPGASSSWMSPP